MRYRKFGKTGWNVSEIGFGAWQLGGTWGEVSETEAQKTLLYAFDKGVNFVDTASAYGGGRSEMLVGAALKAACEKEIFVASKVLPLDLKRGHSVPSSVVGQYSAAHLRSEITASLRRLNRDHIDLIQLHLWFEDGLEDLEWFETLTALIDEGKIRAFGVSLPDIRPNTGVELVKMGLVSSIQVMFNIFEQEPADLLLPAGKDTNTAFIGRVPLDSGALTGTWDKSTYAGWHKDDKRSQMYAGTRMAETLRRINAVKEACAPFYEKLAEAALRFCLSQSAISTVVCGMRDQHEVDQNLSASDDAPFPEELSNRLRPHSWKHDFY